MFKKFALLVVVLAVFLAACGQGNAAINKEANQTANQLEQYSNAQPVPVFEWSLERHIVIEIYRARNEAASTFSYVLNPYDNSIMFECASIGFPIPGGTQLTNPDQLTYRRQDGEVIEGTLPQMEPNGLYSPDTSAGTYISCVNEDGTVSPVFVEWYVWTFPYPMHSVDGKLVRVPGQQPSVSIETGQ